MKFSMSKKDAYCNQLKMNNKNLKGKQRLPIVIILILTENINKNFPSSHVTFSRTE